MIKASITLIVLCEIKLMTLNRGSRYIRNALGLLSIVLDLLFYILGWHRVPYGNGIFSSAMVMDTRTWA